MNLHLDGAQVMLQGFQIFVRDLPIAAYTCDPNGLITSFNSHAEFFWGRRPRLNDAAERYCGAFRLFLPDGTLVPHDQCWMALALKENRSYEHKEILVEQPSGKRRRALANAKPIHDTKGQVVGGMNVLQDVTTQFQLRDALSEQAEVLETVQNVGRMLAQEMNQDKLVQAIVDSGRRITGAQFGAFFYNVKNANGESFNLFKLSGADSKFFDNLPMPRNTALFRSTFEGTGVVRMADVRKSPLYGKEAPYFGFPPGHLPVTSYLAVPVQARSGEVLGGLFFAHELPGVFDQRAENLAAGMASFAAIAFENVRLVSGLQTELKERTRTEAELTENSHFLSESQRIAHVGSWSWDLKGPFKWTDETYRIFGVNRHNFTPTVGNILSRIHPDDQILAHEWLKACREGKAPGELDLRVIRPDGSVRVISGRCELVCDVKTGCSQATGTIQDITDRKHAEYALRKSESRFREMADCAPAMIWITGVDKKCTWCNKPWCEFVGRPLETELGDGWAQNVHAEDVERCFRIYNTSFDARVPFSMEYRLRRRDGIYRWIVSNGIPHYSADGKFNGYIGSGIDITDHRNTEQALLDSEKRLRTLADNVPGVTYRCACDEHWTMEFISKGIEELSGYDADEFLNNRVRTYASIIHPEDQLAVWDGVIQGVGKKTSYLLEYRIVHKNGTIRWVLEKGQGIFGPDGCLLFLDGVIIDITWRKVAESAMRDAEKRLEQYNQKLRDLATQLSLAEEAERRRFAGVLHDRIGQDISYARFRMRQLLPETEPSSAVRTGLTETLETIEKLIVETRSLTFELSPPILYELGLKAALESLAELTSKRYGILCEVYANDAQQDLDIPRRVLLFQSVRELLHNVIKHARAHRVEVCLNYDENECRLLIADDGQGMSQHESGIRSSGQASGFGTFSIRERLKYFGGIFELESSKGCGTRATIVLPYNAQKEQNSK